MRLCAQVVHGYFLVLVLSTVWRLTPVAHLEPDLVTVLAAYLGLTARDRLAPSLAAAISIGYLADLLNGTPIGLMATVSGIACILCHAVQGRLFVRGSMFVAVFSALVVTFAGVVTLMIRSRAELLPLGFVDGLADVLVTAMATGVLGPLVFRAARFVDSRFARTRREREAASFGFLL